MKDIYAAPSEGYVYVWTNLINGKRYVGSHNGQKPSYKAGGTAINEAFKKYGMDAFERRLIYVGPLYREAETLVIRALGCIADPAWYNRYHRHRDAEVSAETRAKMSAAAKARPRRPMSMEQRQRQSAATKGVPRQKHSEETKAKMSVTRKGRVQSEEHKAARSASIRAKYDDSEYRAKVSAGAKSRKYTPEGLQKVADAARRREAAKRAAILSM